MNIADKNSPRFSVITPSFNQGRYLETTIKSVIGQNFTDFEHIVIDGGSKDETISILNAYPHLKWVSEPDSGQANALNKGFQMASGEIIAWINSDDWYAPGAFECVDKYFGEHSDASIVMGDCQRTNRNGEPFDEVINYERGFEELRKFWVNHAIPTQPAIFFKRQLLLDLGYLDESLHYALDFDLWLRFARLHRFFHVDEYLAFYRFHSEAKGGTDDWSQFVREWKIVYRRHVSLPTRVHDWIPRNTSQLKNKISGILSRSILLK